MTAPRPGDPDRSTPTGCTAGSAHDCRAAREDLHLLVDRECDDACRARLEQHISDCPACREIVGAEQRLKAMLSRTCCGRAPETLRERVRVAIRTTTVTTTVTSADGTAVYRHQVTHVERGGSQA